MIPLLLPRLFGKRNAFRLGSLLFKMLLFLPLPAFSQYRAVTSASIPFEFTVNGHQLPAGDYILYRVNGDTYAIRSRDGRLGSYMMAYADSATKVPGQSKLVFLNYGSTYLLDSVWTGGTRDGLKVQRSKAVMSQIAQQHDPGTVSVMLASAGAFAPKR